MENELNSIDPEIIVGLDIGTTKIACFVGQRNEHGKIEILGPVSYTHLTLPTICSV